jgi:hypothetical protein
MVDRGEFRANDNNTVDIQVYQLVYCRADVMIPKIEGGGGCRFSQAASYSPLAATTLRVLFWVRNPQRPSVRS